MRFHLLQGFEVVVADPAALTNREGRLHGGWGVPNGGVFLLQVQFALFDQIATVGALPPGGILVGLAVDAELLRGVALGGAFRTAVLVGLLGGGLLEGLGLLVLVHGVGGRLVVL